jgi:hypothetical protein
VQSPDDGAHLVAREHHRQAGRTPGAHQVVDPRHVAAEDVPVEEQQRAERLVLRGGGHGAGRGQCVQERRDRLVPQLAGMAPAVEDDEAANPGHVGLLGPSAVVARANGGANLVQQSWRTGGGGDVARGHTPAA